MFHNVNRKAIIIMCISAFIFLAAKGSVYAYDYWDDPPKIATLRFKCTLPGHGDAPLTITVQVMGVDDQPLTVVQNEEILLESHPGGYWSTQEMEPPGSQWELHFHEYQKTEVIGTHSNPDCTYYDDTYYIVGGRLSACPTNFRPRGYIGHTPPDYQQKWDGAQVTFTLEQIYPAGFGLEAGMKFELFEISDYDGVCMN